MKIRILLTLAIALVANEATAHLLVDMKMSVEGPAFAPIGQRISYRVIADNLNNDLAFGVLVTNALPPNSKFVKATGTGWNCSEARMKVTCAAEELGPGAHVITIEVNAPAASGPVVNSVSVKTLGSFDPDTSNDNAAVTTTVYDPAVCAATAPQILHPVSGAAIAQPVRLSWSAVPNALRYDVYASVEGERSAIVASANDTATTLHFERGNVAWRVEAILGGCPTTSSETAQFLSDGRPASLTIRPYVTSLNTPAGLAIDRAGDLFIADAGDFTVRHVSRTGSVAMLAGTQSVAGSADGRPASFASPLGMVVTPYDDFLFIADRDNHAIRLRYPGDRNLGFVVTIGGALGQSGMSNGLYEVSRFSSPTAITADSRGRLYVADSGNHRIRIMETVSGYTGYYTSETFAGSSAGSEDGAVAVARFNAPSGIAIDGETLYVADTGNRVIRKIANGVVSTVAEVHTPTGIAVDARGNLFVCDTGNHAIVKIAPSGLVTTVASGLTSPRAIAIDTHGTIYIAHADQVSIATPAYPRRRAARR